MKRVWTEGSYVIKVDGELWIVPEKIMYITEHNNRADMDILKLSKDTNDAYWVFETNSNSISRCKYCGEFFVEFRNCQCDELDEPWQTVTLKEYLERAKETGEAKRVTDDIIPEAVSIVIFRINQELETLRELISNVDDIEVKSVKEFGNGAHVYVPREWVGRKVLIIPL